MNRIVSYYGDDFTGSTDVMEALASHGVATVLFTRLPTADEFVPFEKYQAFGLAGNSRSQTPDWMDVNLAAKFEWLKSLGARLCHYKVCSTFDSQQDKVILQQNKVILQQDKVILQQDKEVHYKKTRL